MKSDSYSIADQTRLLHDYEPDLNDSFVDAIVASGDCFITLATRLDAIAHELPAVANNQQVSIEETIRTLMYLQQHFAIVKK